MQWARIDVDWVLPDSNSPAWSKSAETRMELMIIESAGECKTFPLHYQTDAANPRFRSQADKNLFRGLSQGPLAQGVGRCAQYEVGIRQEAWGMKRDECVSINSMRHALCRNRPSDSTMCLEPFALHLVPTSCAILCIYLLEIVVYCDTI